MMYKAQIQLLQSTSDNLAVHIGIEALLNGHKVFMLIDTGASRTVMDHATWSGLFPRKRTKVNQEPTIGLGSDDIKSSFSRVEEFNVGGLVIKKLQLVLLDLSVVNDTFAQAGLRQVDGIIGGDLLLKYKSMIDYQHKCLILRCRKSKK